MHVIEIKPTKLIPTQKFRLKRLLFSGVVASSALAFFIAIMPLDANAGHRHKHARNAIKGAVVGAIIGGIINGKRGARTGALVGGVIGATRGGKHRKYRKRYRRY